MSSSIADLKQLKKLLLTAVASRLNDVGFKLKSAKDSFVRDVDASSYIYQLLFLDSKMGWRIQPSVAVRLERVEEIFHQTSGFEAKYQGDTPTIGGFVGSIIADTNRDCEFRLDGEDEVPQVADAIVRVFHEFAEPYFERFSSLAAIDVELNDKPTARTPNRVAPWLRCATGSIVAKLVGRPDYDSLIESYLDTMRTSDKGFYLARYQALLDWLSEKHQRDVTH